MAMAHMTNSEPLNYANLPKYLYDFEHDHIHTLLNANINNINLWQVSKVPLFYYILRSNSNVHSTVPNATLITSILTKIVHWQRILFEYIKLWLYPSKLNSKIWCITNHGDCLTVKDNKQYNGLFDEIIKKGNNSVAHIEYTNHNWKNRYNIPVVQLQYLLRGFEKFDNIKQKEDEAFQLINTIWLSYATKKNIAPIPIDNFLQQNFFYFQKHFTFFDKLIKKHTPQKIISSETMCSPLLAAAVSNKVPLIEMQHGSIDAYYPPYVWHSQFNNLPFCIKPNYIAVFGKLAEAIIVKSAYFNINEIIKIGNAKFELLDTTSQNNIADKRDLLIALQPLMHSYNIALMHKTKQFNKAYTISIKCHPLQHSKEVDEYIHICTNNKNIIFLPKNENIYNSIQAHKLIASHTSTILEESVTLGKHTLTIGSDQLPMGIHSMNMDKHFESLLPFISLDNFNDTIFLTLNTEPVKCDYVYQPGYFNNISRLLN